MTASNFDRALPAVLKHEGGYVNNKHDNGGPTNKGITLATFRKLVKADGTIEDLKALTTAQAGTVYRRNYWDAVSASILPGGVDYAVFDMAVNSGPQRAAKFLQAVVGAKQDGRIGPKTMEAVAAMAPADIVTALLDKRLAWLKTLDDWAHFGKGWTSRIAGVRKLALEMARQQPSATQPEPETPVPEAPTPAPEPSLANGINWGRVGVALLIVAALGWAALKFIT
jgi:lysozyme family protein